MGENTTQFQNSGCLEKIQTGARLEPTAQLTLTPITVQYRCSAFKIMADWDDATSNKGVSKTEGFGSCSGLIASWFLAEHEQGAMDDVKPSNDTSQFHLKTRRSDKPWHIPKQGSTFSRTGLEFSRREAECVSGMMRKERGFKITLKNEQSSTRDLK